MVSTKSSQGLGHGTCSQTCPGWRRVAPARVGRLKRASPTPARGPRHRKTAASRKSSLRHFPWCATNPGMGHRRMRAKACQKPGSRKQTLLAVRGQTSGAVCGPCFQWSSLVPGGEHFRWTRKVHLRSFFVEKRGYVYLFGRLKSRSLAESDCQITPATKNGPCIFICGESRPNAKEGKELEVQEEYLGGARTECPEQHLKCAIRRSTRPVAESF